MSKPSIPTAVPRAGERKVEHKRKRRRQSAPAKTLSVGGHRKTESLGLENAMIEEEAAVD